jgi:hypothetical protein
MWLVGAAAAPAIAQDSNTIHIEITDGPDAGTYDVTTSEPCQAGFIGPSGWGILVYESGSNPDTIELMVSEDRPDANFVSLQLLTDDGMYGSFYQMLPDAPTEATVDDRGDTATLTLVTEVSGFAGEGTGVSGVGISAAVECAHVERLQEAPGPVPSLAPPPSLAPVTGGFAARAVIDGGPMPGTYDFASNEPCVRLPGQSGRTQWNAATYEGEPTLSVEMIVGGEGDMDDDIRIDVDLGDLLYRLRDPQSRVDDRGDTATLQALGQVDYAVPSTGEGGDGGLMTFTLECAAIEGS